MSAMRSKDDWNAHHGEECDNCDDVVSSHEQHCNVIDLKLMLGGGRNNYVVLQSSCLVEAEGQATTPACVLVDTIMCVGSGAQRRLEHSCLEPKSFSQSLLY